MSDPIGCIIGDDEGMLWKSQPCRILIFTAVGSSGLNLFRANRMIMVDQFFTHQEAEGRVVRKGQTDSCIIDLIVVEGTFDDRMSSVAGSKGMAASTFFGKGNRTARLLEEGEDVQPQQGDRLHSVGRES